ncbi:MAG: hypothetical protein PWQ43_728 [Rikenellaceae bacterium]|nr:hypothetical protein [Rikenellaceae bacterium]
MSKVSTYLDLYNYQKGVSFDEASHTYYYKNRTLTSVTTAVSNCFPRFNRGGVVSRELALKRGITPKQVESEWRAKADLGSEVHRLCERFVLAELPDRDSYSSLASEYFDKVMAFTYNKLDFDNVLFTEFPVYDGKYSIAGTCDLLIYDPVNDCIDIYDWKTNDVIQAPGVKFGKYGFDRLSGIPDTNYWHYALQLSIYKYILSQHGFKVGKLCLLHITPDIQEIIDLPYLSDEALIVLEQNL